MNQKFKSKSYAVRKKLVVDFLIRNEFKNQQKLIDKYGISRKTITRIKQEILASQQSGDKILFKHGNIRNQNRLVITDDFFENLVERYNNTCSVFSMKSSNKRGCLLPLKKFYTDYLTPEEKAKMSLASWYRKMANRNSNNSKKIKK